MKTISIVTITYNEEGNILRLYEQVKDVMRHLHAYDYEFIVADNCSEDQTGTMLRELASHDKRVKVIINAKNFGATRSQLNALLSAAGDAAIVIPADLQASPDIFPDLIKKWESGYEVVCATYKNITKGHGAGRIRNFFYFLMQYLSETPHIPNFTGIGLYDRKFLDALKKFNEPEPYLRGLVGEIGFNQTTHDFVKRPRTFGRSKYGLWKMYDVAVGGIVTHSKVPMRLTTFLGFIVAMLSIICAGVYFVLKLIWWKHFSIGLAPLIIGVFFILAVQLIAIGVMGEYVVAILTQTKNRPLVVERERINFK